MAEVTLQQTHTLLEKLAEYVMTEVPNRREMNERFAQVDNRFKQMENHFEQMENRFGQIDDRFEQMENRFEQMDKHFQFIEYQLSQKADKSELAEIRDKVDYLIISMDAMCKKQEETHSRSK